MAAAKFLPLVIQNSLPRPADQHTLKSAGAKPRHPPRKPQGSV
jgi:hypothetical protein